jgi:hypothetical protein
MVLWCSGEYWLYCIEYSVVLVGWVITFIHIVTWRQTGIVKSEQTSTTSQRLSKRIPMHYKNRRPFLHDGSSYCGSLHAAYELLKAQQRNCDKGISMVTTSNGTETLEGGDLHSVLLKLGRGVRPDQAGSNNSTVALRVVGGDEKVTQCLGV